MSPSNNVIKTCSINICTFSERSKFTLDKYAHDEQFDAVFVQETGTTDLSKLKLTNMKVIADDNNARNKGAAIFLNRKHTIHSIRWFFILELSLGYNLHMCRMIY